MLTSEQLQLRRAYIGSSDAAAILGCDPFRNRADVYWSKIGELEDRPTEAMELGNDLQPMLCAWAAAQVGALYVADVRRESPAGLPIAVNLDGLIGEMPEAPGAGAAIIEGKSTSWPASWGEPEIEDDLPHGILTQLALQFHCVPEATIALVPRFAAEPIPGGGAKITRRLYRGLRHDDLVEEVVAECVAFMRNHVEPRVPPGEAPHLETLKRILRQPTSSVEVHDPRAALDIAMWQESTEIRKTAEKTEDDAKARVLAHFGDAEEMICSGQRLRYLLEGTEHPVSFIYKPRRVLRIKVNKESKRW